MGTGLSMRKQFTVDSLCDLLTRISAAGFGDLGIFLGENCPLSDDAVVTDIYDNKVTIKNTYYDERMAEAIRRARDDMDSVYKRYLHDCYEAGYRIKEETD